jgi:hypothetical protein
MSDMDEELKQHLNAMEARLRDQIGAQAVHTEEVETRLLGEFWKWARTADARYRQSTGQVNGLAERVDIVEDRVSALERKTA